MPYQWSYWLIQGIALTITAFLLPGLKVTSVFGPILMIFFLGLVNAFLWDASLFYQIPTGLSSHAGMIVLWNALIFWLLVKLLPGIEIRGIIAPIVAPIIFTATTILAAQNSAKIDWEKLAGKVVGEVQEQRDLLKKTKDKALKNRAEKDVREPLVQPPSDFEKF